MPVYQVNMQKVREREDIEDDYIYLERVPYQPKQDGTSKSIRGVNTVRPQTDYTSFPLTLVALQISATALSDPAPSLLRRPPMSCPIQPPTSQATRPRPSPTPATEVLSKHVSKPHIPASVIA